MNIKTRFLLLQYWQRIILRSSLSIQPSRANCHPIYTRRGPLERARGQPEGPETLGDFLVRSRFPVLLFLEALVLLVLFRARLRLTQRTTPYQRFSTVRKEPEGKNTKGKTSENFAEAKQCSQKIFQKISQKIEDITFTGFQSISGYLRNLRGRLLSSEKFSEVFTPWVFTLKPFPDGDAKDSGLLFKSAFTIAPISIVPWLLLKRKMLQNPGIASTQVVVF